MGPVGDFLEVYTPINSRRFGTQKCIGYPGPCFSLSGGLFQVNQPLVFGGLLLRQTTLPETNLGGGFKYFLFSPLPGEDFRFD